MGYELRMGCAESGKRKAENQLRSFDIPLSAFRFPRSPFVIRNLWKSSLVGLAGTLVLLGVFFAVVSSVSGWNFAVAQFSRYWYFLVILAAGFGAQLGLYVYLRKLVSDGIRAGGALAVSGATSTGAMLSCCAHYLTNILPVLGATGLATFAAQYQVEFFWVGIAMNALGLMYILKKISLVKQRV